MQCRRCPRNGTTITRKPGDRPRHASIVRRPGSGRIRGHAFQLPKRIKWSERDEFEAHQVRLAERQLFEHAVRGSQVGYVEDERDTASTLKREPLIDLAIEI